MKRFKAIDWYWLQLGEHAPRPFCRVQGPTTSQKLDMVTMKGCWVYLETSYNWFWQAIMSGLAAKSNEGAKGLSHNTAQRPPHTARDYTQTHTHWGLNGITNYVSLSSNLCWLCDLRSESLSSPILLICCEVAWALSMGTVKMYLQFDSGFPQELAKQECCVYSLCHESSSVIEAAGMNWLCAESNGIFLHKITLWPESQILN